MPTQRLLPDTPFDSLDAWVAAGGRQGLDAALERGADATLDELDASGLRGRGGAGFPTATKWRSVIASADEAGSPAFVVCNAAEGEPGTFKDRTLLLANPYATLEGLLIALHTIGAERAWVGVKTKFDRVVERLTAALEEIVDAGWPGADRIRIATGPDLYLFGEESAMLEVIEEKLPLPRILKPYELGLFASSGGAHHHPTVVNNVETLAHAAQILGHGADWFRRLGTERAPGTMLFTVVGDVANPGVYELPLGERMRTLIVDIAGAEHVKAVFSGVSNLVMTEAHLEASLDFELLQEAHGGLGSGGFVVYDRDRSIVKALAVMSRFLADESCGQCNACKLGTAEISDLLDLVVAGRGDKSTLEAILRRARTVTDQNRCYLPVGEQLMVTSAIANFEQEFLDQLGRPVDDTRPYPTPLIEDIDEDSGRVVYRPDDQPSGFEVVTA